VRPAASRNRIIASDKPFSVLMIQKFTRLPLRLFYFLLRHARALRQAQERAPVVFLGPRFRGDDE
jgi:hypothetical protein